MKALRQVLAENHRGHARAVKAEPLIQELARAGVVVRGSADLRAMIHTLRVAGVPVGSHPNDGYWMIENEKELRITLSHLTSRMRHQAAAIRGLNRAYGERIQMALDFAPGEP